MKVLLLAAGYGKRLLPLTKNLPKCLVPICNIPLLKIWIDKCLEEKSIESIYINTHYLSNKVETFLQNEYSDYLNSKIFILYEPKLLGTAGTIKQNKSLFKDQSLIVIHADNLSLFDFKLFIYSHLNRPKCTEITMMTFDTDNPSSCGIVKLDNKKIVTNFFEKKKNPPSNIANGAVYIFDRTVIDSIGKFKKNKIDISLDIIPLFLNKIFTYHNYEYHRDIGNIKSYNQSQKDFRKLNAIK